jgi:hypothetical protein
VERSRVEGERGVGLTLHAFRERRRDGWSVLTQDPAITAHEPAVSRASMPAAREGIGEVKSAHTMEEIDS